MSLKHLAEDEFVGRVALVTGASSGIGEATALELARRQAKVYMLVRSAERGEKACERIRTEYPAADLHVRVVDLALMSSVAQFCRDFTDSVDILVNNAGVYYGPYDRTKEGVENVMATNHLGHFLLTCLLLTSKRIGSDAHLILVTAAMYKSGNLRIDEWDNWRPENYNKKQAYQDSKLAVCLFALWLRSALPRVAGGSARVFAVHPGCVHSGICRHMVQGYGAPCRLCLTCSMRCFLLSPRRACQSIVLRAAISPEDSDNIRSGLYFNRSRQENWHPSVLDKELVMQCWDFSFDLVQRSLSEDKGHSAEVLRNLKKLRDDVSRDSLDDLRPSIVNG